MITEPCRLRRESDEIACSTCHRRWSTDEETFCPLAHPELAIDENAKLDHDYSVSIYPKEKP